MTSRSIYRRLKGLRFISGLRGLIGRANRSSSFASSAPEAAGATPDPPPPVTIAFRDARPLLLAEVAFAGTSPPLAGRDADVPGWCVCAAREILAAVM